MPLLENTRQAMNASIQEASVFLDRIVTVSYASPVPKYVGRVIGVKAEQKLNVRNGQSYVNISLQVRSSAPNEQGTWFPYARIVNGSAEPEHIFRELTE